MTLLKRASIIVMIGLLASLIFLLGTTAGLRTVLLLADRLAGAQVSLGAGTVEGRLLGHFVLHETWVETPTVEIKLERAELAWRPLGLLGGVSDIELLKLTKGRGTIIGSDTDDSPAKDGPGWLPDVHLEMLDVSSIEVIAGDKLYQIEQLSAQAALESQQLNLTHAELQMPHLTANANGVVNLQELSVASVQLEWNWQPSELLQPLTGAATLNGDTNQLQLTATLSSPAQAMLNMELEHPFKAPVWRAEVSMAQLSLQQDVSADLPDVVVSLKGISTGNSETAKLDATGNVLFDEVSRPWQLDARVPLTGDGYPWLVMTSGQASIAITPDETRPDLAYVQVDIPDFGELWLGLAGQLQGEGELLGERMRPAIKLTVNGTNLIAGDHQIARIDAEVKLDSSLAPEAPMLISAQVEKAHVAGNEFDGDMRLEGTLRDARLDLRLIETEQGDIELSMKGGLDNDTLSAVIERLALDHPDLGKWQTSETSALRITRNDGQLSRLCLKQTDASLCTELAWQGTRAAPHFNGSAILQLPVARLGEPATVFKQNILKVQLDGADISVDGQSELDGRPLRLSGHGNLISVDDWRISLTAQADDVPVSAIPTINQQENFTLAGLMRMNLELAVDNTYKVEHLDAEILLKDGMLKRTFIDGDEEKLSIHELRITAGKQQENLVIAGKLQDAYAGHLKMNFVLPAELDQLSKPDLPLNGRLTADFPGLQDFGIFLDDVTLPEGTLSADIGVDGTLHAPYFNGSAILQLPVARLGEPATVFKQNILKVQLDGADISVDGQSELGGRPLRLSGHGNLISVDDWRISLTAQADDVPVSAIPTINQQENFTLAGLMRMNLELAVDNTYKVEHLDAEILLKDGMLKRTFIDGDEEKLSIHELRITAGKQQENLVIAGKLQDAYAGHLKMNFVLPAELDQLSKPDLPLNGRLTADFPGLQDFGIFLDDVTLPEGTLSADIGVEGTRAAPQLQGRATLKVPRLDLSEPEISFDDTTLAIKLDGNELSASGGSQIDGRPLTLEGRAVLHTFDDWDATLQLAGDSISLENIFGSSLHASPDLTVAITPGNVDLTGDIVVEGSNIFIRDISTTVRPSSDVRIVDEEQNASPDWHVTTDLGLRLTGDNHLRVAGFNGLLAGNVRVRSETGKLTTGEGVLTVNEGVYRAFGTTVPIQRGRLEFIGGALDDPAIQIESRRRVERGEVGFDVTGTLQSPVVTLVSSPTMEQSEILSWLLFGRGAGDTEGISTALLAGLIQTTLGREEEESFMQRMLNRMGMTNLEVVTDTSGVGLSKQLTPRLFVKYQVNVWNQTESRLILRYLLSEHWALEGISGDEGGGDILYERER